eukprot:m.10468 g.10468  ORF g.10468 m.10468 type:complete len:600 (-) comp8329_c0_seq1:77-1876(-)
MEYNGAAKADVFNSNDSDETNWITSEDSEDDPTFPRARLSSTDTSRSNSPLNGHKSPNPLFLIAIAFFWVSGIAYGSEGLLRDVAPELLVIGLIVAPFAYALPIGLMSTEMQSVRPCDGGMVSWVEDIVGSKLGGHNAYWVWMSYMLDSAIYPVFAAEYLRKYWDVPELEHSVPVAASALIAMITVLQLVGHSSLVTMTTIFAVCSLIPLLIFIIGGGHQLDSRQWTNSNNISGGSNFGLWISWMLWMNQGYVSIGTVTERVFDGTRKRRSVWLVLLATLPLVFVVYFFPLMVAWGIDSDYENYSPGHMTELAGRAIGKEFQYVFLTGAILALIAFYVSASMASTRVLYFLLQTRCPQTFGKEVDLHRISKCHRWCFLNVRLGVPIGVVLCNTVCVALAVWLPYQMLIQATIMVSAPSLLLLCFAYVQDKRGGINNTNNNKRNFNGLLLFRISEGPIGASFVVLLPVVILVSQLYFTLSDDALLFEIPYFNAVFLSSVIGMGGFVHLCSDVAIHKSKSIRYRVDPETQNLITTPSTAWKHHSEISPGFFSPEESSKNYNRNNNNKSTDDHNGSNHTDNSKDLRNQPPLSGRLKYTPITP